LSYLVDTNVLSEFRKAKPNNAVRAWARKTSNEGLFISVLSVGELENGAERVRKRDPVFAAALDGWITELLMDFGDNILPISLAVARRWGKLTALGRNDTDVLIAATALEHTLTVATRDTRHFVNLGVPVYDPFS
jgi:predicted nucleic acid-binding protein